MAQQKNSNVAQTLKMERWVSTDMDRKTKTTLVEN